MSRDVPFYEDDVCDGCGKKGAFDFMGDCLCSDCLALPRRPAYWTHDHEADGAGHLYYFAPVGAAKPPSYTTQREVKAVIDIAQDGTLAGVELIYDMPPPPREQL